MRKRERGMERARKGERGRENEREGEGERERGEKSNRYVVDVSLT